MIDPEKVHELVEAITDVVEEELEGNPTSASEVVSALFSVLNLVLNGIRKMPNGPERHHNATTINRTLMEMMIDTGKLH